MRARARLKIYNGRETHFIDKDNISFFRKVRASIKSFRKTPDVIFHLITNIRLCQRTLAQVRIRGSAHESCDRGSVLANSCSIIQRWELEIVQKINFAPGSNENWHNSRVPLGGEVQRWLVITIQSVDVGTCLDEAAHHCGRALEVDSKVQGGRLGGNSGEQQQIKNYWPS